MASLSPAQQKRYQQDLLERENQASSLAAAGLVAESVSLTGVHYPQPQSEGLPAPPLLSGSGSTPNPVSSGGDAAVTELDSINWNLMDNLGAMHLDDMDMDFATLFDPVNEMWNLSTPGKPEAAASAASTANGVPQEPPAAAAAAAPDGQPSSQQQQQQPPSSST